MVCESKKDDGSEFAPSTLICMRAAIQRFLTSPGVNRQINLMDGQEFQLANNTLKASIGVFLRKNRGKDTQTRTSAIDEKDLEKLSDYFDRTTPEKLQHEIFYNFIYHFGYRGREWMRSITKESVQISVDESGREYVDLLTPLQEKNVKPSTSRRHYESNKTILMYALPDNPRNCPVEAVKEYLSKLRSDALFPKPLQNNKQSWFSDKQNLGKNMLNDMMKKISFAAGLGRTYTNHCIRATVVTELAGKGYSVNEIQNVTGHKRPESVNRYVKRISASKKQKISNDLSISLHKQLAENNLIQQQSEASTSSSASEIQIQNNNKALRSVFSECSFSNCNFNFTS